MSKDKDGVRKVMADYLQIKSSLYIWVTLHSYYCKIYASFSSKWRRPTKVVLKKNETSECRDRYSWVNRETRIDKDAMRA